MKGGQLRLPKLTISGRVPRAKSSSLQGFPSVVNNLQFGADEPSTAVLFKSPRKIFKTAVSISLPP